MRRIAAGLIFGLFATSLCAARGARADTATGGAYITTLPSGAEVWFDGTFIGRSPIFLDGVAAGRHVVTVTKTGWTSQETAVMLGAGTVVMSSTRLVTGSHPAGPGETGLLVLRDVPPGASLVLDGAPVGTPTGPLPLSPGSHRLAVATPHGRTTRPFAIYPGTTTDIVLREERGRERSPAVVAPAEDYLPTDAFSVDGSKIVVRYSGHLVVAHLGDPAIRIDGTSTTFDSAPEFIGGKLYLPLELLEKLSGDVSKGP